MTHRRITWHWLVALAVVCTALTPSRGACPLWENLSKARQNAEDTANKLKDIVLPKELERRIMMLGLKILSEYPGMSGQQILKQIESELSIVEKAQAVPWLAAKLLQENADAAFRNAQKAYNEEMLKKDAALKIAEEAFEKEQQWLETEKAALKGKPVDDAYLDRVSQITKQLKAAYQKMQQDLKAYRDCFPDANNFLVDKEDRLKRIDEVDAEVARRRGLAPATAPADGGVAAGAGAAAGGVVGANPADPNQPPAKADPDAPGPLGDTYVLEAPVVSPTRAKFTSVSANGFSYEKEHEGKKGTGGIKIIKPPPAKVRVFERVELVMTADGGNPAWVDGSWELNNVIAGQLPCDNGCSNIPNFKREGNSSTATVRFFFGQGENAYIRMYGGEYDSRDGTRMDIVWRYRKEGGP